MSELLIRDVWVDGVDGRVDVVIRDGRIESIGDGPTEWKGEDVDGAGALALSGLVSRRPEAGRRSGGPITCSHQAVGVSSCWSTPRPRPRPTWSIHPAGWSYAPVA